MAEVAFPMPENLTGWKVLVWSMGHGTKVGQGSVEVVTRKDLILRLQAPRFFVETDEVVLSANVHNYLKNRKTARVELELEGGCLALLNGEKGAKSITIDPNGEKRVDWRVKAVKEGEAVIRMKALTDEESDAVQMHFPVYVHGMTKQIARSGVIRPDATETSVLFDVPAERRVNESRLELRFSPSLAGAMVDALPYLTSYPYGCTEQTLNRFLPTVITRQILLKMGLDLAAIKAKRTNLNAQELGADTQRAGQWRRYDHNPVFDQQTVDEMVRAGVQAAGRYAVVRWRLGLVQRIWRKILSPHHGLCRSWAANRPGQRCKIARRHAGTRNSLAAKLSEQGTRAAQQLEPEKERRQVPGRQSGCPGVHGSSRW